MKQGTVTLDINDYDKMLENSKLVEINIIKEGSDIKADFPELESYVDNYVKTHYPNAHPESWNCLYLKYTIKDSNE